MPSASQDNSLAYNGFKHEKHVRKEKLDYDLNLSVEMENITYHNYLQMKQAWKSVVINQSELEST